MTGSKRWYQRNKSDSGVAASKVFAQLADQQAMLLNMSEEEIKVLAEKTAELTKQGLSMDKLRGISDSMLDIEGSIQKQMKARAFGLGEMLPDQQAMRDAAMEMQYGDATKGAEMMGQKWYNAKSLEKWDSNNNRYILKSEW